MYSDKVIKQLTNKGLKLQENVTVEEVQYYLKILEMEDAANSLKENLERFIKCKKYQN